MRKFFLFVLPAVLCTSVTQARSALWSPAFTAGSFDSTHQSSVFISGPEKVCEAATLHLQPNFSNNADTYLWITPSGKQIPGVELTVSKISKAEAGVYALQIISASGAVQKLTTKVDVIAAPSMKFSGNSSVCEGSVLTVTAQTAGNGVWTLPEGTSIKSKDLYFPKVSLSDAGKYVFNVDEKGCAFSNEFVLNVKATPSVEITGNTTVCESSKLVLKTKQDSAAKYTWWKGQNAVQSGSQFVMEKADYTKAGKYLLQAKSNGCVNSAYFNIDVRPSFPIGIEPVNTVCEGETIQLKAKNAGEGAQYNWKGPGFIGNKSIETLENVKANQTGNYELTVNKNGCSLQASINISVGAKGNATVTGKTVLCENETLKLTAKNNQLNIWTLPNGQQQSADEIFIASVQKQVAGRYTLKAGTGACADTASVIITVNSVRQPKIIADKETCDGNELKFTAENATTDLTWLIPGEAAYISPNVTIKSSVRNNGVVKLMTKENGCVATDSMILKVKSAPALQFSSLEFCQYSIGSNITVKEANGVKGFGLFTGDIVNKKGEVITGKEGLFYFNYTYIAENGCSVIVRNAVKIKKGIQVNAGADLTRKADEQIQLNAIASDNFTSIEWTNITGAEAKTLRPVVKPDFTTTYKISVKNSNGCAASDEVVVNVMKINLPNAFSPNGDGINDLYTFEALRDYPNAQIQIFNATGKLVFSAKGYSTPWDGRINGTPAEAGTYYYNINLNNGKPNALVQGWIQLKR